MGDGRVVLILDVAALFEGRRHGPTGGRPSPRCAARSKRGQEETTMGRPGEAARKRTARRSAASRGAPPGARADDAIVFPADADEAPGAAA